MFLCKIPEQAERGESPVAVLAQRNCLGFVYIFPGQVLLVRNPDIRVNIDTALSPVHFLEDGRIRARHQFGFAAELVFNDHFDETRHRAGANPVRLTDHDRFLRISTKRDAHGKCG